MKISKQISKGLRWIAFRRATLDERGREYVLFALAMVLSCALTAGAKVAYDRLSGDADHMVAGLTIER